MGMPVITPGDRTGEQAITDLIESIAMQERALSHILNAESEKMQTVINMEVHGNVGAVQITQLQCFHFTDVLQRRNVMQNILRCQLRCQPVCCSF